MFAKIFGPDDAQVLVTLAMADDGFPELRISFEGEDGLILLTRDIDTDDPMEAAAVCHRLFHRLSEEEAADIRARFLAEYVAARAMDGWEEGDAAEGDCQWMH